MLETVAALALCVQVSDYAAFHLSYHPDHAAASDAMYEQSEAWGAQLGAMVPDADAYIITMFDADKIAYAMDGAQLMAELTQCRVTFADGAAPDNKG